MTAETLFGKAVWYCHLSDADNRPQLISPWKISTYSAVEQSPTEPSQLALEFRKDLATKEVLG